MQNSELYSQRQNQLIRFTSKTIRRSSWVAVVLLWLHLLPAASGVVLTHVATRDNTLYQVKTGDGEKSNALGHGLFAGNTDSKGGEPAFSRRAVIAFTNIHNFIPSGAVINDVTLRLYLNRTKAGGVPVTVHRLLRDWGEGESNANGEEGKGANATPGDATWAYSFFDTESWTVPGGDYVASASASTVVAGFNGDGQHYDWSSAQLLDDVRQWVTDPSGNFGWIVIGKEVDGEEIAKVTAKRFSSRHDATPANRPTLIVDYSISEPLGACNLPGGDCTITTSSQCTALGGTWEGPDTTCPELTGACCLPDGGCADVTASACADLGGTFQGEGVECAPDLCPIVLTPFVDPLPVPAPLEPVTGNSGGAAHYEITMRQLTQTLHRDLPPTTVWAYGDAYPGPLLVASNGAPVTVNWINDLRDAAGDLRTNHYLPVDLCPHGPNHLGDTPRTVVHLHGGHVPAESDGYPEFTILPGESVVYDYPNNQQAALIWFHDHALGITRLNVYMGLAGLYVIRDAEEAALNLPSGEYEVPLVIQDRKFHPDGSLSYPAEWTDHFFGDKMLVNGKVWPYHNVRRGKYRLRLLNGCNSRTLLLGLSEGLSFTQIGTDDGLLSAPFTTNQVLLTPGERSDTIVDFRQLSPGTEVFLTNSAPAPYPGAPGVGVVPNVMKFIVQSARGHTDDIPTTLVPVTPIPTNEAVLERTFFLRKGDDPCSGQRWLINDLAWDDITEFPVLGTSEIWSFYNQSGVMHPMHMHLVFFQVLDRQPFTMSNNVPVATGPRTPPNPGEAGWKDTVPVQPNEIVRVIARFEDYTGRFAYHCHVLEHEDHEMMRQFEVVLPTVNYSWVSDQFTLNWLGTNWQLQSSTNLTNWSFYPGDPTLNGTTNFLPVPTTNTHRFFRLIDE